jgi:hypothetical protein
VSVKELLRSDEARFFLPSTWNVGGPWISREALLDRLQYYLAEKEKYES